MISAKQIPHWYLESAFRALSIVDCRGSMWHVRINLEKKIFPWVEAQLLRKLACLWLLNFPLRFLNWCFDKLPENFAKQFACDKWRHVRTNWSFEIRGSARGFWASPFFEKWNASFEKRIRLLRKETPLLRKESDVWERSPDSSICERTLLWGAPLWFLPFYRDVKLVPQHTWAPSCKHFILALPKS